jgi:predicted GIY-YIG superfamily endonuclease
MFYCYVLRIQKTGQRYVGSCENLTERIRRHNARDSKATKHGVPWVLVHSDVPKQRNASDITRPDKVEMSSRGSRRAVAAATGRGFKSHLPDK